VLKQERGLHNKKFIAEFSLLHKKGQSKFILETTSFYIDQFGLNSNIEDISFSGKLSEQRVGICFRPITKLINVLFRHERIFYLHTNLQDTIVAGLEAVDGQAKFKEDLWNARRWRRTHT
jgi:hypothetical protein